MAEKHNGPLNDMTQDSRKNRNNASFTTTIEKSQSTLCYNSCQIELCNIGSFEKKWFQIVKYKKDVLKDKVSYWLFRVFTINEAFFQKKK